MNTSEAFLRAKAAALKALEIDNSVAEAHTSLAYVKFSFDWDWDGAEKEFKHAMALKPDYPTAHHWYAEYLAEVRGNHEEALSEIKRAQELDPLSLIISSVAAWILYFAREYDNAIAQVQKTLDLDGTFWVAHWTLGWVYEQKVMFGDAIAELQKAVNLSTGTLLPSAALAHAYAVSGRASEALESLENLQELSRQRYISPYSIALIFAGLGDNDHAFQWLEKAYAERSGWLIWLKVDPKLDGLRCDPRFQDLVGRVGLPR